MAYSEQQIAQLILKYFSEKLNASEKAQLESWIAASPRNRAFFDGLSNEDDIAHLLAQEELDKKNDVQQQILHKIREKIDAAGKQPVSIATATVPVISKIQRTWWIAAASILLVLSASVFIWIQQHKPGIRTQPLVVKPVKDVLPGSDRAVLTLSDGRQVELNADGSEVITDGELSIANNNGELQYANATAGVVNTMTTPRGGQYKVILADGSKVWLNAASSISYPTLFKGNSREVSITGEVYFEVKTNKAKPFIVQVPGGSRIEVSGTQFNVNAYGDEAYQTTTLVEGQVSIVNQSETVQLKPGLQAKVSNIKESKEKKNIAVSEADLEEATGWRNNLFVFNKADIPFIMRQLSRWYNLEISYNGEVPKRYFQGKIPRNIPLSRLLSTLKMVGVNFEIKNETLVVSGAKNE